MSIESNITREALWHRWESKTFNIDCGTPLAGTDLRWLLLHQANVLIEKTTADGITIDGEVAEIEIASPDDYEAVVAGVYRHELWDESNKLLLSYGDAWLLPGAEPEPEV